MTEENLAPTKRKSAKGRILGLFLAAFAILVLVLWLVRQPIAEAIARNVCAEQGLACNLSVTRLDLGGVTLTSVDARAPGAADAAVTARELAINFTWQGLFSLRPTEVKGEELTVRLDLTGKRSVLGDLDKAITTFTKPSDEPAASAAAHRTHEAHHHRRHGVWSRRRHGPHHRCKRQQFRRRHRCACRFARSRRRYDRSHRRQPACHGCGRGNLRRAEARCQPLRRRRRQLLRHRRGRKTRTVRRRAERRGHGQPRRRHHERMHASLPPKPPPAWNPPPSAAMASTSAHGSPMSAACNSTPACSRARSPARPGRTPRSRR